MKRMWLKGKYWQIRMDVTTRPFKMVKTKNGRTLDWSQSQTSASNVNVHLHLPKNLTPARRKKVWSGVIKEMKEATAENEKKYGFRI